MASPDRSSVSVQIQFDRDDAGFTGRIRVGHEPERNFSGRLELMRDLELAYAASRKGADAGPGEDRHEPRGDAAGTAGAT